MAQFCHGAFRVGSPEEFVARRQRWRRSTIRRTAASANRSRRTTFPRNLSPAHISRLADCQFNSVTNFKIQIFVQRPLMMSGGKASRAVRCSRTAANTPRRSALKDLGG
jgi:hypothetical protein